MLCCSHLFASGFKQKRVLFKNVILKWPQTTSFAQWLIISIGFVNRNLSWSSKYKKPKTNLLKGLAEFRIMYTYTMTDNMFAEFDVKARNDIFQIV